MSGSIRGIDEEIIHIDNKSPFCDHIAERVVHEPLKGGRRGDKAKEHYGWFKKFFVGDEGGFPLVSILDMDIVISLVNVKFGEDFHSLEFINKVRDEGEGVCITDRMFVDIAVILTEAKTAILLFDNEEGECLWGVWGADFASF